MPKKIIYYLVMFLIAAVPCAIISSSLYHRLFDLAATLSITSNRQFFLDDPILGYKCNPGTYHCSYNLLLHKPWKFDVLIDVDGLRSTSANPQLYCDKPEIWIFGCSFTFGWPLNNHETFAWLLQQRFKEYNIKNFALGGYGNIQALLQLKENIKKGKKALIAVFVYNRFHLPRNVAAPSFLQQFQSIRNFIGMVHYPQGYIDSKDGCLRIRTVPIVTEKKSDPDLIEMREVTKEIFAEIYRMCIDNTIVPVFAYQSSDTADPIISFCRSKNFHVVDMFINFTKREYNCLPYDNHPNSTAHKFYADQLTPVLERLLQDIKKQSPGT